MTQLASTSFTGTSISKSAVTDPSSHVSQGAPLDTLWYTRCPVPTGLGIAIQKGWLQQSFNAQGTKVKSLRESDDKSVRESHFDHNLQNSVRHGGNIPGIWAKAHGRDTRLLGLSWADETQLILTTQDSGIKTAADLKGRRVGLPKWLQVQIDFTRAQALRGLENALKTVDLKVSDVELVDYVIDASFSDAPAAPVVTSSEASLQSASSQDQAIQDQVIQLRAFSAGPARARSPEILGLLRGEVDAIFLKGAHAVQVAQLFDLHTVIDTGAHPDPLIRANNGTPRTLTVDRHLVENHYSAAVNLVEQVVRAERWAAANPESTRQYLARETNASEAVVTLAYGENAHLRLGTSFSEDNIRGLQDFVDFLARWNFIDASFDVREWIEARPLADAARRLAAIDAATTLA